MNGSLFILCYENTLGDNCYISVTVRLRCLVHTSRSILRTAHARRSFGAVRSARPHRTHRGRFAISGRITREFNRFHGCTSPYHQSVLQFHLKSWPIVPVLADSWKLNRHQKKETPTNLRRIL
ncbi:hypothetical protein Q1695_016127 [Nippostrongylus brasiliensis]|nr:hypothetical protein Q1695_016127 [Nippostrongylus brasiliensis]